MVVFALWIESAVAQVQPVAPEARMPSIRAQTLNQRELTLPQELPGEVTLVLMAFEREQQVKVDTWIVGLNLKQNPFAWVETPVIEPKNWLVRAFIDNGMRGGITDTAIREKTITLYTDRAVFLNAMGLGARFNTIYAAVVARDGRVLGLVEGGYSAEKAASLVRLLTLPRAVTTP